MNKVLAGLLVAMAVVLGSLMAVAPAQAYGKKPSNVTPPTVESSTVSSGSASSPSTLPNTGGPDLLLLTGGIAVLLLGGATIVLSRRQHG